MNPELHRLTENIRQYRDIGFLHGWTPEIYQKMVDCRNELLAQDRADYEAQTELLRDKTPVMPAKRQERPLWELRPCGTSQVCESGLVLEDSSQGTT